MAEKDAFKGIEFPKGLAPHQIEAIKNGGSAPNPDGTGAVTLESLGFDKATLAASAVDASAEVSRLREENEALKGFLPNSKTEIEALSVPKLKALATLKGVNVEGDDKAAYLTALLPKEGK